MRGTTSLVFRETKRPNGTVRYSLLYARPRRRTLYTCVEDCETAFTPALLESLPKILLDELNKHPEVTDLLSIEDVADETTRQT